MKNKNDLIFSAVIFCSVLFPSSAYAENHHIAGLIVSPTLILHQTFDSNILSSNDNEKSSFISVISPALNISKRENAIRSSVLYDLEYAKYLNSQSDEYLDQQLVANISLQFSAQSLLRAQMKYLFLHDDRGTGFTHGSGDSIDQPDKYNIRKIGLMYRYGSVRSTGRLEFEMSGLAQRYSNRDEIVYLGNRNYIDSRIAFYYQIRPKTSLLFELENSDIDYRIEANGNNLDNNEKRLFVGSEWDITAITTGFLKIGVIKKTFESEEREEFMGTGWRFGAVWKPLTYSTVNIQTSGKTNETIGTSDYIESKIFLVGWEHQWHKQWATEIRAKFTKNNFKPTDHHEEIWSLSLLFTYKMRRWLSFDTGVSNVDRSSSQTGLDFKRNLIFLKLTIDL